MTKNYDFLFILIVGDYENSNVKKYFLDNFKNIFYDKFQQTIRIIYENIKNISIIFFIVFM